MLVGRDNMAAKRFQLRLNLRHCGQDIRQANIFPWLTARDLCRCAAACRWLDLETQSPNVWVDLCIAGKCGSVVAFVLCRRWKKLRAMLVTMVTNLKIMYLCVIGQLCSYRRINSNSKWPLGPCHRHAPLPVNIKSIEIASATCTADANICPPKLWYIHQLQMLLNCVATYLPATRVWSAIFHTSSVSAPWWATTRSHTMTETRSIPPAEVFSLLQNNHQEEQE